MLNAFASLKCSKKCEHNVQRPTHRINYTEDFMHQSIPAVPIPPHPPRADPGKLAFFENELANAPPPGQKSCSNAPG